MPLFEKGKSGNPGGRPSMPQAMRELIHAKGNDIIEKLIGHMDDTDPRISLRACELLLARGYGRELPEGERITIPLPDQLGDALSMVALHQSVMKSAALGELSIESAKEFSTIIENQRRLHETADLDQRLSKLEKELSNVTT